MAGRYTGQQLTLESQTFSVHMFSRNKTIEREGSDYSSGAKYFGHRPRLLGRCLRPVDPHHMLNSMQDDRRTKMPQKIARNN